MFFLIDLLTYLPPMLVPGKTYRYPHHGICLQLLVFLSEQLDSPLPWVVRTVVAQPGSSVVEVTVVSEYLWLLLMVLVLSLSAVLAALAMVVVAPEYL